MSGGHYSHSSGICLRNPGPRRRPREGHGFGFGRGHGRIESVIVTGRDGHPRPEETSDVVDLRLVLLSSRSDSFSHQDPHCGVARLLRACQRLGLECDEKEQ